MKNAVTHLIRYAKAQGLVLSVHDGERWETKLSTNEKEIMDTVNSVDEATIAILDPNNRVPKNDGKGTMVAKCIGKAFIVNGLDNDELVADCTANEWFDKWTEQYNQDNA